MYCSQCTLCAIRSGFWVLGRLGHDWRACRTNTHPVTYVFIAFLQEPQNFEVETEEHLLTTAVANYLDPSKFACPMSRRKCSMTASMHRTITISQDKSVMSCGEHVTHPCRSQLTVFKLGLKLSFPVTSWYLVLCEKLQSFPGGASRQASARFCVHAPVYHTVPRVQTADLFSLWRTDHTDQMPQRRAAFKRNKCLKMSKAPIMFCSMYIFAI